MHCVLPDEFPTARLGRIDFVTAVLQVQFSLTYGWFQKFHAKVYFLFII